MNKLLIASTSLLLSASAASGAERSDSIHKRFDELVVTGSASPVAERLLPYSVSVVGEQRLENSGSTRVLSVISGMVPSLFVTERSIFGFGVSSSGGSGHIKMRGVGGDRASGVLMMVDGQPQFAGIYSHHVADFYAKENVERVEVLRGPGSVLYGSNALAGAINVITRNPGRRGVKTSLTSQYGSYNTWLSSLSNTVNYGRFSSLVSLSYNRTDGTRKNFDFKQAEGYVKVGVDLTQQWKATADYTLMNLRGNDPIYPTLSNPESTDIYSQNITRGEGSLTFTNRYASTSGAMRAYYSYGNHFVDDPRHFHSLDDRLGLILYQTFTPWSGATVTAGFDFDTYSGKIPMSGGKEHTEGSLSTIARKRITEYSPYLTVGQQLFDHSLSLNAGLRMANSNMFHTQWVPQFGFSVNPGLGLTVKGNLAMGYRNPSFRELYLYRMANPDLDPERMMNYELAVGKHFSRYISLELTGYFSKGTNLIQTLDQKNQNTGRFVNKGLELTARSHPLEQLTLYFTYSYLHTSLSDLTGAPEQQYYFGADWTPLKCLQIGADLKGIAGLYVSDGIERQNYALLNMKITWEICRYVSVFTRLENITDARYVINRGYPMPGFTALGGFTLRL
ncbi:MAG: TonB-dependent receptor [Bacteroidales bacterium]|nr:TonB-dependent receptor [Bacteroidales bacterium]